MGQPSGQLLKFRTFEGEEGVIEILPRKSIMTLNLLILKGNSAVIL